MIRDVEKSGSNPQFAFLHRFEICLDGYVALASHVKSSKLQQTSTVWIEGWVFVVVERVWGKERKLNERQKGERDKMGPMYISHHINLIYRINILKEPNFCIWDYISLK